jgi:hypothetical protein
MNDTIERSQTHATFVIERTYPAPVEAVWHALSDNDARDQWFSAGEAFDAEEKSHEFRVGGHGTEEGQWHETPAVPLPPSERQNSMTIVTAQMSVSADGFYAGPTHADVQTWLDGPEAAGFFRVTRWAIDAEAWRQRLGFKGGEQNTNSEVIAETFQAAGAYVMGRRMADGGEIPWGEDPPFRAPGAPPAPRAWRSGPWLAPEGPAGRPDEFPAARRSTLTR